jgi:hypothetical protein
MTTTRTDAHTDAAPFTPQSQGAIDGTSRRARRIPIGNAMPMKNPIGSRIATATAMRSGVAAAS